MKMLEPRKWKQAILSLIFLMFYAILMLSLGLLLNAVNVPLTSVFVGLIMIIVPLMIAMIICSVIHTFFAISDARKFKNTLVCSRCLRVWIYISCNASPRYCPACGGPLNRP